MRHLATTLLLACVGIAAYSLSQNMLTAAEKPDSNKSADKLYSDGNWQEALTAYQRLLQDAKRPTPELLTAYERSSVCLQRLNKLQELDSLRESVVEAHSENWQVVSAVAQSYLRLPHYGYMVAGEFHRGHHRGGGKLMNAEARDRVRALQLHWQAFQLLKNAERGAAESSWLSDQFAAALMQGNAYRESWRLQILTDFDTLPDYEEGWGRQGWGWRRGETQGAPVDDDGKPVYYALPASWEDAKNDGERWRWLLNESIRWHPQRSDQVHLIRANFLRSQFGVETMAQYDAWFRGRSEEDDSSDTGTFALHTLGENETIARLATGVRRFELPAEQNHIPIYQEILAGNDTGQHFSTASQLASVFENRRQYNRAVEYWRKCQELIPNHAQPKDRLDQILKNWGQFEPVMSQPAGRGATVDFRFRNGRRVEFTAHRIRTRQLLDDVKAYIKSNPPRWDWNQVQLENLGYRLITQGQDKYLDKEVARWSLDLEPRDKHFDRRITVTTPLQESGAYLLTSKMDDGNSTSIVLWLSDTAIVKKPLAGKTLYYVADAVSGLPVKDCNVEFFGYWQERRDNKFQFHTKNFAEFTNADGMVELPHNEDNRRHQWVAVATTPQGRFAYLGFQGVWHGDYYDQQYKQVKVFTITDRPVYRPEQKVEYKFWVRHAQYDLGDESKFAGKSFLVEIRNPKNEKVFSQQLTADAYGGIAGTWEVPEDATLGQYRINVAHHGGGTFRVEEYKKPEFEVTIDAPEEPIKLGDHITATIQAKYYFGEPVTEAKVKYKVLRSNYDQTWYPPMPWDWLYGSGYWWFAQDYEWYPGWARWGCRPPHPWWFWQAPTPPEVIAEQEVAIGPDGTVKVVIDTSVAKQFHPDHDHSYQIQAEVVDQSRRTIVGNGRVLVARQPFRVYVWTQRGYYRVGDTIQIGAAARTLDDKPVEGKGVLRLLKVKYEDAKPVETEVGRWELATGEEGKADLQIKASEPGQYRISYELTDSADNKIEGGHMLTVAGEGFDGSEFRFNDLELVPDQRDYQPGDKVALQINTNRAGAAVLLFARPSNGIYLPPKRVQLKGKSQIVEIDVTAKDSPNFFVEAVTVHGGRAHTVVRELFVPPVKRVLNVEVVPSAEAYLPGQDANLWLKLTDLDGKPYVGSLVLSIYDKSLEYISGGSNVADIREFFWKWRRSHQTQGQSNLERGSHTLVKTKEPRMQHLGVFGATVVDEIGQEGGYGGGLQAMRSRGARRELNAFGFAEAAPAAAADEGVALESDSESLVAANGKSSAGGETALAEPTVRENFADTALWIGTLETNGEGLADANLKMPENLTSWKIRVWGMGHGTRVGEGSAEVVTRKNLILRMQAPRFFVEKDEVVLSANVHNYLKDAKQVRVQLDLEGDTLTGPETLVQTVEIAAGGEKRVDWRVKVVREGTATIRMSALTDEESDAMQMSFPVYVHGMLKTESYTGVLRPDDKAGEFTLKVPAERRAEQTKLELRYSPTLAGAMVDALPYLIDYPYGCTEQTLNRFLPAVLTQQTLKKMGLNLVEIQAKRTNLNAQEIGDDVERAKGWKRFDRNPVFDEEELTKIVKKGVNRLTEMQLSDGGWGWFSGWGERSYPHTTAVVMHGLLVAKENGVAIVPSVLERGTKWLEDYQSEQVTRLDNWGKEDAKGKRLQPNKQFADNTDALVYMVLSEAGRDNVKMRDYLYRDRTKLAVYSLATFGLALHKHGDNEKLAMVMRNISQYVQQDDENQTAWLELAGGGWWYWWGSEYEAHAYYLKLLAAVEPKSEVASRMVKYLLNNRKHSTYWNSTRDTALVVEAFADYLKASGEDAPDVTVELWVDGEKRKEVSINRDNLFTYDNKLVLADDELTTGRHTVEIRKQGKSPIYWNGYLTNFTLEDDIEAAGLELKVERRYFKLTPVDKTTAVAGGRGQALDQKVEKYERSPLVNLAQLKSGDLVEVELVVESKNDYEYILLEDMKAAGFEPVEIRSGYKGNELGAYMELRDDRVSLFVTRLARGKHSISYRLRAEIPGRFSALPTKASAMYAPELKANSDEIKLRIED
jgi:uncharacterized protein YfaS (alpha-2-macroglobulin family)